MKTSQQRSPLPLILVSAVLLVVVVAAVTLGLGHLSRLKFFRVESTSMAPTLRQGETVRAMGIKNGAPIPRGRIVVMNRPATFKDGPKLVIKRVVGLPGETISSVNGKIEINGVPLAEPYLAPSTITSDFPAVHLGPNSYFVLGDNRGNSADSRFFGPVPAGDIKYGVDGNALRFP